MLRQADNREHFVVARPAGTHRRLASCQEVECAHNIAGWVTTVDIGTILGIKQAEHIRYKSGRRFTEERIGDNLIRFVFALGQQCFREHHLPLERGPLLTRNGHVQEFDQWIDGWNENAYRIRQLKVRGG